MKSILTWLDRLTARWWFGEAVVITTCVGILAHESALQGGKRMPLPEFTFLSE